jgi:hypothetical protein
MLTAAEGVIAQVSALLETYANRGVFRAFARGPVADGTARFKLLWHRDQSFDLYLSVARRELRFPVVLPGVPAGSDMYAAFRQFIQSTQHEELPAHRRIDANKARVRCANRSGNVSLALTVVDGDFDYGVRKLIQLVHEVYLGFLVDGPYLEYMVSAFQLDPDRM